MVPPASHKVTRASWYSGCQPVAPRLSLRDSHPLRWRVPTPSSRQGAPVMLVLQPQRDLHRSNWFGLVPVRSPLLRESRLISLRRATEMFQFAHCPPSCLLDSAGGVQTSLWTGCPIRNLRAHRSHAAPPERFAGLRVLRRPSAPRHPPRTLSRLCSPGCSLLFAPSPLHLFRSRSRPTPPRHATHRDRSSRHTHSRFLCFSRSLSSCLGNIEVIILMQL